MASGGDSPLGLDPERMRELGYRTVDMLVDRLTGPPGPVVRSATPRELSRDRGRLAAPAGARGRRASGPPALRPLDDRQAERVLHLTREHHAAAGEPIVEQWQVNRDLYVVLGGAVAVSVDGKLQGVLGKGDIRARLERASHERLAAF